MCARYTMATPADELIAEFEATLAVEGALEPQFNIAPTDRAPIVVERRGTDGSAAERRIGLARFGLIPHWAKDDKIGVRMLNARSESAAEKPAYRDAFARRRCLVVADGFYEWEKVGRQKLPLRFVLPGRPLFALAGLWSVWDDANGDKVSSFSILTRAAVGAIATIHERMPIVLPKESYAAWLDRDAREPELAKGLLEGHIGDRLQGYRVSSAVGNVRAEGPTLIEPIES